MPMTSWLHQLSVLVMMKIWRNVSLEMVSQLREFCLHSTRYPKPKCSLETKVHSSRLLRHPFLHFDMTFRDYTALSVCSCDWPDVYLFLLVFKVAGSQQQSSLSIAQPSGSIWHLPSCCTNLLPGF